MGKEQTTWLGSRIGHSVAVSDNALVMSMCAWCVEDSCRTHAQRDCCCLRWLAKSPNHLVRTYALKLSPAERDTLRPKLAQEKRRLQLLKESKAQRQHGLLAA